eukprot:457055_1
MSKRRNICIINMMAATLIFIYGFTYRDTYIKTYTISELPNNVITSTKSPTTSSSINNDTDSPTPSPTVEYGITPLPKKILPELPILTNMICDDFHNIDSTESKLKAHLSRSCLFTDYSLCYDFIQTKWIYYTDIDAYGYDINGQLQKLHLPLTLKDVIMLRFASNSVKSWEPETENDKFTFTVIQKHNQAYNNNTFLSDEWTIFGITTVHWFHISHILTDNWYKIYKAIDNFVYNGIIYDNTSINLIMKKIETPIMAKFRNAFEPILFNDVSYGLDELYMKHSRFNSICFKNMVIGTSEYSGMLDAIHTNNQLYKYIRKRILNYFSLSDLYKPNEINILFLKKTESSWKRTDFIANLVNNEIIEATKMKYKHLKHINILSMDPKNMSIDKQVHMLHKSLIIISPIGNIGFTNFLQPLNAVQIYLIKWGIHPDYLPQDFPETFIPENDHELHNTQGLQYILKYADLSEKYNYSKTNMTWSVNEHLLFPVIDKALRIIQQRFHIHA